MKSKYLYPAILASSVLFYAASAQASTMPKAESDRTSLAIGLGPSFSYDALIAPHMTLGFSLGLPFLVEGTSKLSGRYDVRLNYKFLQQGAFSLWYIGRLGNLTL